MAWFTETTSQRGDPSKEVTENSPSAGPVRHFTVDGGRDKKECLGHGAVQSAWT